MALALLQFHYSDVDWGAGSDDDWEAWRPAQAGTAKVGARRGLHHPRRPASARPSRPVMGARFTNWYHAAVDDFAAKKQAKRADLERRRSQAPSKRISRSEFLRWYEDALRTKSRNFVRLKEKYDGGVHDAAGAGTQHDNPVSKAHFERWYTEAVSRHRGKNWADDPRAAGLALNVRQQPVPEFNACHFSDWVEEQTRALNEPVLQ